MSNYKPRPWTLSSLVIATVLATTFFGVAWLLGGTFTIIMLVEAIVLIGYALFVEWNRFFERREFQPSPTDGINSPPADPDTVSNSN